MYEPKLLEESRNPFHRSYVVPHVITQSCHCEWKETTWQQSPSRPVSLSMRGIITHLERVCLDSHKEERNLRPARNVDLLHAEHYYWHEHVGHLDWHHEWEAWRVNRRQFEINHIKWWDTRIHKYMRWISEVGKYLLSGIRKKTSCCLDSVIYFTWNDDDIAFTEQDIIWVNQKCISQTEHRLLWENWLNQLFRFLLFSSLLTYFESIKVVWFLEEENGSWNCLIVK